MLHEISLRRLVRPSAMTGITITEFASDDTELTCPYFHQRFFTSDGRFLVCQGRFDGLTEAVLVDREEAKAYRLTDGGANAHGGDMAPDGRTFFFTREGGVWSVDVSSGHDKKHFPLPDEGGYRPSGLLHVNATGSLIAVAGNREHASGVKTGCVWTIAAADGKAQPIVERPFAIGHVQFSTVDPGLVMYCHETGGAAPQRMWLARTDGPHPGALFHDPGHPWVTHETFTGNGQRVVFIRHPEGLALINPDNTGYHAVDAPGAWHPGPSFDGTRVAFDTHGGELWLADLRAGKHRKLSAGERGPDGPHMHPRFAPDDATLVWTSSRDGQPRTALLDIAGVSA